MRSPKIERTVVSTIFSKAAPKFWVWSNSQFKCASALKEKKTDVYLSSTIPGACWPFHVRMNSYIYSRIYSWFQALEYKHNKKMPNSMTIIFSTDLSNRVLTDTNNSSLFMTETSTSTSLLNHCEEKRLPPGHNTYFKTRRGGKSSSYYRNLLIANPTKLYRRK